VDITNLRKATSLLGDIEHLERTLDQYRAAESMTVSLADNRYNGPAHHVSLTAAELGDAIVDALQNRLAKMRVELRALGVTVVAAGDTGRP
jgi:hypothetical protein